MALRREEDHGRRGPSSDASHDLESIELGEHDVDDGDVGLRALELEERFLAVARFDDIEPGLHEIHPQQSSERGLVIDDEDTARGW